MSSLQIATITRTQDYTVVKQNEDNRGFVQQTVIGQQQEKDILQRTREVRSSDNAEWQHKRFDAKDKGANEYAGDGGRRRRQENQDQVQAKGRSGFDIKI